MLFSENSLIHYGYLFLSASPAVRLNTVRQAGVSPTTDFLASDTLRLPAKGMFPAFLELAWLAILYLHWAASHVCKSRTMNL
jgi:hypothetical protein